MLNWKAITFIIFVFVLGSVLCFTIEGSWFSSYEQSVLQSATSYDVPVHGGFWGTVRAGVGLFTDALPKALAWDYSFLEGDGYDLLKYVLLYPISAGFIYGIAVVFIGTISRLWTR